MRSCEFVPDRHTTEERERAGEKAPGLERARGYRVEGEVEEGAKRVKGTGRREKLGNWIGATKEKRIKGSLKKKTGRGRGLWRACTLACPRACAYVCVCVGG